MSPEQEISIQFQSKGQELGGKPCQETGVKIGRATRTLMAKAFQLWSPQVTVELSQATTWPLLIGSLVRPLKVVNSRFSLLIYTIKAKTVYLSYGKKKNFFGASPRASLDN